MDAYQAMSEVGEGISEKEICKNLQKEVTLIMLDRERLKTKIVELKEEIEHFHKTETFKVFEALFA